MLVFSQGLEQPHSDPTWQVNRMQSNSGQLTIALSCDTLSYSMQYSDCCNI